MGLCDPCKFDNHEQHRSKYPTIITRRVEGKRVNIKSVTHACDCRVCLGLPLGHPQPLPKGWMARSGL